jgi:CheY-like chemotaxis protein
MADEKLRVLCVDDEPRVLEGLQLHLRRHYAVATAGSGPEGLTRLAAERFAIVLSDMRMPGMDGAQFLAEARAAAPDSVRMLLTGHADLEAAIAAINEGQVFRMLTKPCAPEQLLNAFAAAAHQHQLITAERVLLEQTLQGSVRALTDVLALTNPVAFGRATRVRRLVVESVDVLGWGERWQVEMAAMLSQLGAITLPGALAEKVYYGQQLADDEARLVGRLPLVTEQLLRSIPRLDAVRAILSYQHLPAGQLGAASADPVVIRGAGLLRAANDLDQLEGQGFTRELALETLRGRYGVYEPAVLDALTRISGARLEQVVRELPLPAIKEGMVFAEDVRLKTGGLLVARGYEVTAGFLERIRHFPRGAVREPVKMVVGAAADS